MPRSMRRDDRALTEAQTHEILHRGEYGILSTISADGQPYGVPLSFAFDGQALYFHCAVEGHKLDNLTANPRVSFCVVGETEVLPDKFATRYESAIVFGQASELLGSEKLAALTKLLEKYSASFVEKGEQYIESDQGKTRVFKVKIESLSGKARR